MGRMQLAGYGTPDTPRDDSDKSQIRKHPIQSPAPIHVHCVFRTDLDNSSRTVTT